MIKILVIDDDETVLTMIRDSIDAYNLSCQEGEIIEGDFYRDDKEVYKSIFYHKYDCIILDVNWGIGKELGGKELAERIVASKRIPIIIYSGNLNDVEDLEEKIGFKKFVRTTAFTTIIGEILQIKRLKVFDLLGYEGVVDRKILNIFWDDIDSTQEFLTNISDHASADALTRIITTRMIEILNSDECLENQKYFEFYIYPSLSSVVGNGDIIRLAEESGEVARCYLVITPVCQLLHRAQNVNLLRIENSHEKIDRVLNSTTCDNKIRELKKLLPGPADSLHFIPPLGNVVDMGLVDFNRIRTISKSDLKIEGRIVTINPTFMKDIQSRFAQCFSKQGQPDLDIDHLLTAINNRVG